MARFALELPLELMRQLQQLEGSTEELLGAMTRAGAEVVLSQIQANVPESFRDSDIMNCLKLTRTYRTPSDGGINTKVAFSGYFTNHKGVPTPAPLVANVFEYGSSKFPKQPFLRRSFRKDLIRQAMLKVQKEKTGGLLDE